MAISLVDKERSKAGISARGEGKVVRTDLFQVAGSKGSTDIGTSSGGNPPAQDRSKKLRDFFMISSRVFSKAGTHPYDELTWTTRDVEIKDVEGKTVFAQEQVIFPESWSQMACTVVASKYFRGLLGSPQRESDLRRLIDRVVDSISIWGLELGYLANKEEADLFSDELKWLTANQYMAFNSPVWFNVGVEAKPQCSACFINSVQDTMESILGLARTEGMLFKYGSGSGVNLSSIRSSKEPLGGGGKASGPVSFMKGFDAFAGVIKSGGKNRRAAKMVILDVAHPDILEFIWCKADEEKKAKKLMEVGYSGGLDGEAYSSIFFQNANNSVRVSDEFMQKVVDDGQWSTRLVLTGEKDQTYRARDVLRAVSEATWQCGDPGLQFHDTVNSWHTVPASGPINGSNPCSEFMFLDDSACNLASLNLMKFVDNGGFDTRRLEAAVKLTTLAQEILVDASSYPTPLIAENSRKFRPLGLGYANLGALLMSFGLPYNSEEGRSMAAALTALVTAAAYRTSAKVAKRMGTFEQYGQNRESMLRVMRRHQLSLDGIRPFPAQEILDSAKAAWEDVIRLGERYGFRNAQTTVLAPTGTIGFMMDCDTTGVEPELALVKYKKLVGGGTVKLVNNSVAKALNRLGYSDDQVKEVLEFIDSTGTIEGAPHLDEEHLAVFDCAIPPANGERSIHHLGHIRMLASVQPFVSGAISKTVNMPRETTVEEIMNTYIDAWKMGLKAIAIYRDGSKGVQPLTTRKDSPTTKVTIGSTVIKVPMAQRRKLPDEREAITHKFSIAGHEGYITVGKYEDGTAGEIFITMAKQGSTVSGLVDAYATAISLALQYGVPLDVLVGKFAYQRFEPAGFTTNAEIPMAKSIVDYVFRWLGMKFLDSNGQVIRRAVPEPSITLATVEPVADPFEDSGPVPEQTVNLFEDAPSCHNCGDIMVRNGSCYRCSTCGETSGCS